MLDEEELASQPALDPLSAPIGPGGVPASLSPDGGVTPPLAPFQRAQGGGQ